MDERKKNIFIGLCVLITILEFALIINQSASDAEDILDIRNASCTQSVNIGRRLFLHVCLKDNKTVYDIRYFWKNHEGFLKADIIGIQMTAKEFLKVCNYCF